MDKLNKNDVLISKINEMKKGAFGVTAIKIELEAQLNRHASEEDDEEERYCRECENERTLMCQRCDGDGLSDCAECGGDGFQIIDDVRVECSNCEGDETFECSECDGSGEVTCAYCEDWPIGGDDFSNSFDCKQFMLKHIAEAGLAKLENGQYIESGPLVYSKFYNDHSVDSEFTFTISLEKPESALLIPKVLEAFKALGEAVGNGIGTGGAGMHMALLNDPACYYSENQRPTSRQLAQFKNFRRSMQLLLPALFFLGSVDEVSRSLEYRHPRVECSDNDDYRSFYEQQKYSAIAYRNKALEFRVFETCYDAPEAVLDNIVVIANAVRYWRATYRSPGLDKVVKRTKFGQDRGNDLARFYATVEHVDLLNEGLKKLKPSYYSVKQLKEQRKFTVNKRKVNGAVKEYATKAELGYQEYADRFNWDLKIQRQYLFAGRLEQENYAKATAEDEARIAKEVEDEMAKRAKNLKPKNSYVQEKVEDFKNSLKGIYTLSTEV